MIHLPVSSDTSLHNMFPVAELSNLNNDFSFLDDICLSEDPVLDEKTMADLNFIEGTSFPETNILSEEWLSGNVRLDVLTDMSTFHQSEELNHGLFTDFSDISHSYSCTVEESTDMFAACPVDEPPQIDRPSSEGIYSSDEIPEFSLVQQAISPLIPENDETVVEHSKEETYNVAGKKYLKMREKNNIASRRSRKLRKEKNIEMDEKLKQLEIENQQLTKLAEQLERERDALQRQLLQAISKK